MAKIVHSQIEVKPAKASQGSHGPLRLPQTQNASARFFRTLLGVYLGNGCCLRKNQWIVLGSHGQSPGEGKLRAGFGLRLISSTELALKPMDPRLRIQAD